MGNGNVNRGNVIGNVGGSGSGSGGAGVDRRVDEIINGTLPVGLAKNLVTAIDMAQNGQTFIRRTSGGSATIRNGKAHLNKVYGNAVKEADIQEQFTSKKNKYNDISINQTKFLGQISTPGAYEFVCQGSNAWTLNGSSVLLRTYGITTDSNLNTGDTIVATVASSGTSVSAEWKEHSRFAMTTDMTAFRAKANSMVSPGSRLALRFVYYTEEHTGITEGWYGDNGNPSMPEEQFTLVLLSEYGISVTGNPTDDDQIEIAYTRTNCNSIACVNGRLDDAIDVDSEQFLSMESTVGEYEFSYDGTAWSLSGSVVNITDYGIDVTIDCYNGDAIIATVKIIPSEGVETKMVTCRFKSPTRYTATINEVTFMDAFVNVVNPGETLSMNLIYYQDEWYEQGKINPIILADIGITVTSGVKDHDALKVTYTRANYGGITFATPSMFTAYGLNLFNAATMYIEGYGINANGNVVAEAGKTLCYARAVYNSSNTAGYTVYDSNKTVTKVGWVATLPTTSTTGITLGTANSELSHVTFAADGYVVCVCTKKSGVCIHPTWDGEFDRAYAEYSESVITFPQSMALYAVSSALRDELNLTTGVLTHNVTRIAFTEVALAALLAAHTTWVKGTDYIHDNNYIYHRATTATTESVTVSGKEFNVNVYSLEEFGGTNVAVGCDFTYGNGSVGGGSLPTEEAVTIQLAVSSGSGVVAGKTMTVRYTSGSQEYTQSLTADASGKATINIPYGAMYRVEPSSMSGYMALNTPYNPAVLSARTINITYTLMDTGFFVITTDKQIIPRLGWNTDWNDRAEFVMYYDSQLAGNPIIYPKILNVSDHIFQPENIDCPLITNRGNTDAANADFAGQSQCALWLQWARTPDATTGKSPVQTWNEGHSASLTEYTYLAAIGAAYNKTKTWSGETIHGYLPAMGQLRKLCDNRTDAAALHTLIGGSTFPNLASGYWWSCSEYITSNCWSLNYGSTYDRNKGTSNQVFALYDLSDVNL